MPPRATIVEEFDDDTDLPLPSRALPNMGTRGALLEEITSDDEDDMEIPMQPTLQPKPMPSLFSGLARPPPPGNPSPALPPGMKVTADKEAFKNWMQIYPIYIDAKQPFKTGCRRIAREKSIWWPISLEIAQAASTLGFNVVHEAQAFHPRDWDNPGRVRVNWVQDGKKLKPQFKTKKHLLETISGLIQQRRPELIPKSSDQRAEESEVAKLDPHGPSSSKTPPPSKHKQRKVHTPKPPKPYPPLAQQVSAISPGIVSGVLVDAVKRGMDAMKQQQVEAQGAAAAAGVGKGKRKVLRSAGVVCLYNSAHDAIGRTNDLRPSARHKLVAQLAQTKDQSRGAPVAEGLQPVDYGHYLLHSLDLKVIIPALSHSYLQTRCLAAKAFAKAWLQLPADETVAIIGGATGLADILNKITFKDARDLAQQLGHNYRGPDDPRTHLLDNLIRLLVPLIAKEGVSHPVSRLGSSLATRFLPAVSPATVSELSKFVSSRDAKRLRRLLYVQPAYIAEFLQSEYSTEGNHDIRWETEDLTKLFAMPSVRGIPSQQGEHWGISLFVKLVNASNSPLLNFRPSVTELLTMGSAALQNAPSQSLWEGVMEALLSKSNIEWAAGRSAGFTKWRKVILNLTNKMAHSSANNAEKEKLKSYLKKIGRLAHSGLDAGVASLLPQISSSIRQDVMRSLHCLADGAGWTFPEDADRVNIATIAYLKSAQGRPILRQMESHFDKVNFFYRQEGLPLPLRTIASQLASQPADRDDAVSVAMLGRWAYLEGDTEGQKQTQTALERWKRLVHRQKQAESRLQYTRVLLTIASVVGDTNTLKETFAWVFERFYKDVDVRPIIFQSYMSSCVSLLAGEASKLEATTRDGDETIGLLIDIMSKSRTEPGFQAHEFTSTTELCRQVLWARLSLCQNHSVSDSRTEAVISPLIDLFMRIEKVRLEDPGTFDKSPLYPELYKNGWPRSYTIDMYPSYRTGYRRVLVKFMDGLGKARDALYADHRSTMDVGIDDQDDKQSVDTENGQSNTQRFRYAWPYEVEASTFEGLSFEKDAPFLYAFVHKIVYTPLEKVKSTEDVCYERWNGAVGLYAGCANTNKDRDAILESLIQHYRTKAISQSGNLVDLSVHLLSVDNFRNAVQRSEALVEEFFSPYLMTSTDHNRFEVFFGTPDPGSKNYREDANLRLFRRRRGNTSLRDMMEDLSSITPRRGSHRLRRQIAILSVIFWIHSLRGRDAVDKGYNILASDYSTLDFASIYSNAALPDDGTAWKQRTIISGIDQFTVAEIQNILKTVKSLISRTESQPHRDAALRMLAIQILPHSHVPTLMEEDVFEVLADSARSSLHRGFFNGALLASLQPAESKRITKRFLNLISELISRNPDKGTNENAPTVKISTIKYLVTCAAQAFTGFSLEETSRELQSLATQQTHPSVQETLLSEVTEILVTEGRLHPQAELTTIWKILEDLALVACSLDETRQLSEKDWSKPTLPEIALNNQRPGIILRVRIDSLPADGCSQWASMVEGILAHQVQQTKRWLNEFLRRRSAPAEDIEFMNTVEFGPLLSCLSLQLPDSYKKLYRYLPSQSWHLRILQSQVPSYLVANKLTAISSRFSIAEPDWKKAQDGKDFTSLLNVWSTGHNSAFRTLVSVLQEHGGEGVQESLRSVLQELLRPSAMLVAVGNHLLRSTPWEALRSLIWALKPAERMTEKEKGEWKDNIRPLAEWMAERVLQASLADQENQPLYMALVSQINSLCLPFPFLLPGNSSSYSNFASQVYNLALQALKQPSALLYLDEFLKQTFSQIVGLSGDYVATAKYLIQQAEEMADEDGDGCLLGYRLVQYFSDRRDLDRHQREQMKTIMIDIESHHNVMVRMLALSRSRTLTDTEYAANGLANVYASPSRGRLMGRARGQVRGRGRRY